MPTAEQQSGRKNGFDAKQFHEILKRFNAGTADEVDAAFCDALRICDRLRISFCDAARMAYGQDERVAELDQRLGEALAERGGRDRERASLAEQLAGMRSRCSTLVAQNEQLRLGARFCGACENLRRVLAAIAGSALAYAWIRWMPAHGPRFWSMAIVLALGPVAFSYCRWHLLLLRRKINWISRKDNDLVRFWKQLK